MVETFEAVKRRTFASQAPSGGRKALPRSTLDHQLPHQPITIFKVFDRRNMVKKVLVLHG